MRPSIPTAARETITQVAILLEHEESMKMCLDDVKKKKKKRRN